MKKIIPMLLLVCLLCGCTQPSTQETQTATDPAVQETTAVTEPSAEPSVTLEDVELEAVNVHAFRKVTETPEVAVLDHRTAAFLTTEYPDKDYSRKCTRVQVVDLHMDMLITETLLDGTYTFLLHCGAPGHIALVDPETRDVIVLDQMLREVLTFQARDAEGVLAKDLDRYYFTRGSMLYYQDPVGGGSGPVCVEYDLEFYEVLDYDPAENILLVSAYSGTYAADLCICAVDMDTEELLLLSQNVTGGMIAGDGVLLEQHYTEERYSDVYYCDWTDGELRTLPGFLMNNLDYAGWHISGSDYVCRVTYDAQKVDIVEFQLFRLGETVGVCSLQEALDGAKITRMYALPDGNLLALEATRRGYRTYLICPELLEFADAQVEIVPGAARVDGELMNQVSLEVQWDLPQELEQVRQQADALEAEYGITILLSGQCTQALASSSMTITTTDQAGMKNEAGAIEDALEDLEDVLEHYPEDFFRQFRNDAGERGLLVMLVEDFEDEMNIIGVAYELGQWYPIAVDITSGEVENTYFHEIWHATEYRIQDLSESALDLAAWNDCNPAGFKYSGNMTPSYIEDTQYTYFMGPAWEDVYFVDPYAKINGNEDRARLMEYIMCSDLHARMLLEHPAMRAKLQILCDAIRQTFDTENWEDVYWERFL